MSKKHSDGSYDAYVKASRGDGDAATRQRDTSDEAFGRAVQELVGRGMDPIAASLTVQRESGELY